MSASISLAPNPDVHVTPAFSVEAHPHHKRLRHIRLNPNAVEDFFARVSNIDVQALEYVPFLRFIVADALSACLGEGFAQTLRSLTQDRATGGFTVGVEGTTERAECFVKFGTAVGHLLGGANHDSMSGTYYARFVVQHSDASDSYLRQAYRLFTLHTDGTFVDERTDWLLMMKFSEHSAQGGESRLMHLDDWAERERFAGHPLARVPLVYKAPASKNVAHNVERPVFFDSDFGLSTSFIDQFVHPRTGEEARYLHDLSASMEESSATREVPLPVGELVVLNNYFWLHGRAPFRENTALHRELMRQRGMFGA